MSMVTSFVPHLSLAERDRRWALVRALMAQAEIDAIFVPPRTGHWDAEQANGRYLTALGGNHCHLATIFPASGDVTVVSSPDVDPEIWHERQQWVDDIRPNGSGWGYTTRTIARLEELGVTRGRIGLSGLAGNTRYPEGIFSHGMYEQLRTALPHAEFVNANPLFECARYVKSDEEIALMREAVALAERALDVLRDEARPGVPEAVVYARMLACMVEHGGELPTMILWSAGWPQRPSNTYMPTMRPLHAGDMISLELEGRYAGYMGQVTRVAFLGEPPDEYERMFDRQQRALARCWELLRPGAVIGDFVDACTAFDDDTYECRLIMHARGLGDDSPLCVYQPRDDVMRNWKIEPGATFIIKPIIGRRDRTRSLYWGDTVVATADGARRLGSDVPEIIRLATSDHS